MSHERSPVFPDTPEELAYGLEPRYGYDALPGVPSRYSHDMFRDLHLPILNMEHAEFYDPTWQLGEPSQLYVYEKPEHRVLAEVFYSDAVRRLQAVEQLTLHPEYTTIPNTGAFSRFEHIWGSVLFVRQMAAKHNIPEEESVRLQLRTLVSDIAHTFGSHLGDWMFQGVGGPENQHDLELKDYLETTGINDILRKYSYEPDEIIFPDTVDWVEAPQPDLCVDRVDYGLREMNRWNDAILSSKFSAEDFTLTPNNMLAMTDQRRARVFAEGFLLLSQEHWSEPTHRFLLDMLMFRTKHFYGQGQTPNIWLFEEEKMSLVDLQTIHPRDLMYVTDMMQREVYERTDPTSQPLEAIMKGVAQYYRQSVWPLRSQRISRYMHQFCAEEAYEKVVQSGTHEPFEGETFDSSYSEFMPALPGFAILDKNEAEAAPNDFSIDLPQPPFKTRQIDPLVQVEGGFERLSVLDVSYGRRLEEHLAALQRPKVARLMVANPKARESIQSLIPQAEAQWQHRLQTTRRMTQPELKQLVDISARNVFGQYPFMGYSDVSLRHLG